MILLQVQQVARYFGADTLFENIQLEVQDTHRIALVGRNGAGKSTLLKMIAGEEEPDAGKIVKGKDITIGYLAQNTGLNSAKNVWDEMLEVFENIRLMEEKLRQLEIELGDKHVLNHQELYEKTLTAYDQLQHDYQNANGFGYEAEIRSVLHGFRFYETDYQKKVNELSGGQKTRLALAKLLLAKKDLLILDEPTNHLDIDTLAWLENYLITYQGALLIVSHDRYFLDKVVNQVYELSRQKITHFVGNYSKYLVQKAANLEQEWKEFEKQQTEIAKLEDFVSRNLARASTTKRAQSRRKKLEKLERLDRPQGEEKSAHFMFQTEKSSGNVVLTVEEAAIGYKQQALATAIQLDIRKQDAIALVGPNGIGKSTLLKSIIGEIPFIKGSASLGANVTLGYYDQEQAHLVSNKTVLAELWDVHPTIPEKDIRSILGSFLFSGDDVEKLVSSLSGGEKARLALAKLAMDRDNFLILDEPTNHLDIDSKEVLENALIDYDGTILFVSHDRYFINRIATSIVELSEKGSKLYLGDYDYYLEKKLEEKELLELKLQKENQDKSPIQKNKVHHQLNKAQQKITRQLTRKIEGLESELATVEAAIEAAELELTKPDIFGNHLLVQEFNQSLLELNQRYEALMNDWEHYCTELENLSMI